MIDKSSRTTLVLSLFLTLSTLAAYFTLPGNDFVSIDDNLYITNNKWVQEGLTRSGILWAFTTTLGEFYHPLTWLSLMLDTTLLGYAPASFHLTALMLHWLCALLLFFTLRRMTKESSSSAIIALLFAIHPLHVESVAWAAERKDLLSALFFLLAIYCHIRFSERPSPARHTMIFIFFLLGLLSKTMIVTLPFVLLLLDYWPLGRTRFLPGPPESVRSFSQLLLEKAPLFVLSLIFTCSTFLIQQNMGGVTSLEASPIHERIANVLFSYGWYVLKIFDPRNLAFFYPFNPSIPSGSIIGASCFLIAMTIVSILLIKREPSIVVGWFWYLGTLLPVSGIIRIGDFARADRFTYLPLIGIFILLVQPLHLSRIKRPLGTYLFVGMLSLITLALVPLTNRQVAHWRNSPALYAHALRVTTDNHLAHYAIAPYYAARGDLNNAIYHFTAAVSILPEKAPLHVELGRALAAVGNIEPAMKHLQTALTIKPRNKAAHYYIGLLSVSLNQPQRALIHLLIAFQPDFSNFRKIERDDDERHMESLMTRALELEKKKEKKEAVRLYGEILKKDPNFYPALDSLTRYYITEQKYSEALALFGITSDPNQLPRLFKAGYSRDLPKK